MQKSEMKEKVHLLYVYGFTIHFICLPNSESGEVQTPGCAREAVGAPPLEVFKATLEGPWAACAGGGQPCPLKGGRGWNWVGFRSLLTQAFL